MAISIDPPVEAISPYDKSSKPVTSAFDKLQREGDFFQSAWEDVFPFLMSMHAKLVDDWGFRNTEQSDSSSILFDISHKAQNGSSSIILQLPSSIHSFLPRQPFPPGHADTIIRPHEPVHIGSEATSITPVLEIIYLLQCFLPGVIPIPLDDDANGTVVEGIKKGGRTLPEVKWLLGNEMMLREAFGCTYFRSLVDAAREHCLQG